tara:strand:+ start:69 stop:782 length:714 start_codon:yes stop_codon:yes gene_type:complete
MIKFFRKIRQDLLSKGKTGKYFKYAIGEIVLVVIGILIALAINNWNEQRKSSINEKDLILTIIDEIKSSRDNLKKELETNQFLLNEISKYLDNNFPESEKDNSIILALIAHNNTEMNIPLVVSILEKNISHSISDNMLLKKLRELNSSNESLVKSEHFLDDFWNSKTTEFLIRKKYAYPTFDKFTRNNVAKSERYRELYDDDEYKNLISLKWILHKSYVSDQENTLKKLEEILEYLN